MITKVVDKGIQVSIERYLTKVCKTKIKYKNSDEEYKYFQGSYGLLIRVENRESIAARYYFRRVKKNDWKYGGVIGEDIR